MKRFRSRTKKCFKCQCINPNGSLYCNQCGTFLNAKANQFRHKNPHTVDSLKMPSPYIYRSDIFLRFLIDKLKLSPLLLGLTGFFLYYGVTFVINMLQGTLLPYEHLEQIDKIPIVRLLVSVLPYKPINASVITDLTHTVFSFVIPFFGFILYGYFVKNVNIGFKKIRQDDIFDFSKQTYAQFVSEVQKEYDHWLGKAVSSTAAFLVLITFVLQALSPTHVYWWGHYSHGPAGFYLAFIVSLTGYYCMFVGYTFIVTIRIILKLKKFKIILHPFHPDKCNGLCPIGRLISYIYAGMVIGGVGIFSTYFLRYFGVEKSFVMWLAIVGYLIIIPIMVFVPTIAIVSKTKDAKLKQLYSLEEKLQCNFSTILTKIEQNQMDEEFANKLAELNDLKKLLLIVENIIIWPFGIHAVRTIIGVYLFQIILVFLQLIFK